MLFESMKRRHVIPHDYNGTTSPRATWYLYAKCVTEREEQLGESQIRVLQQCFKKLFAWRGVLKDVIWRIQCCSLSSMFCVCQFCYRRIRKSLGTESTICQALIMCIMCIIICYVYQVYNAYEYYGLLCV
jgi:hypothetical protein